MEPYGQRYECHKILIWVGDSEASWPEENLSHDRAKTKMALMVIFVLCDLAFSWLLAG